ncbi:MAG: CHAT domain-containing protein [Leptolyngbya sp. SIO1E4]|nr:CHAT domain-containing protein [Leptolyngbya sp. SIO1E4]
MDSLLSRLTRRLFRVWFLCSLLLALGLGSPSHRLFFHSPALAQAPPSAQLVQDGVDAYNQGDYGTAIAAWQQALETYPANAPADRAIIHENLARAYQRVGETTAAINAWEAAAEAYQQSENATQFGRMLTEQAQAYISLGQHQRAAELLCGVDPVAVTEGSDSSVGCEGGAFAIAEAMDDGVGQAAALGSLAETYRLRGNYDTAQSLLAVGLQRVRTQNLPQYEAPLLNSLGNTYGRLSRIAARRAEAAELLNRTDIAEGLWAEATASGDRATDAFDQAIAAATAQPDAPTELRSHLSLLALYQSQDNFEAMPASRQRLGVLIEQLPASRETAYAAIALAKSYEASRNFDCRAYRESPEATHWLDTGRLIAARIQDDRAESFALGELGHLEECRGRLNEAAQLTNRAQLAASNALESADSLYLWEWQSGRIYLRQNEPEKALAAYAQAIATLEEIRTDILTADQELQFDFRDTVAPIYRQYIELQLAAAPESAHTKQRAPMRHERISTVLETVDSLRLAELQNFFGNDCILVASEGARERLLQNERQTAVISSVVLSDRLALIASFADNTAKTIWVQDSEALKQTANEFQRGLKRFIVRSAYDKGLAQTLYQQLISEFEADFAARDINTLVFIHDGFLRNIPMAALHDGEQYLIQRYAIATTPSLGLTAAGAARSRDLRALAVGLSQATVTESGRAFNALNFVPAELASIAEQLPGSKTLLDGEFTEAQLKVALAETRYPILHLATHGQFSTIPEDTFVVTGSGEANASEELTFGELEALIRAASPNAEPIDLITLTACETATGDDRATLGLAGVAIRAGARSAIASLWKVNDETAAELVETFYQSLNNPTLSKAQALQAAQIAAIEAAAETANPGYWAPLILVGNWQ